MVLGIRGWSGAVVVVALSVGCIGGVDLAEPENGGEGTEAPEVETGQQEWFGEVINPYDLDVAECWVEWRLRFGDNLNEFSTRVPCDGPHEYEVYHQIEFPAEAGAPYLGEAEMQEWANEQCYEQFQPFVSIAYEVSLLEIHTLQPTFETWTTGPHREVTCSVHHLDGDDLIGTARNAGI